MSEKFDESPSGWNACDLGHSSVDEFPSRIAWQP